MNWDQIAAQDSINKTKENLTSNNFLPLEVNTKEEALEKIKELIPEGASVMNGTSTTLEEIGYIDLLKSGNHKWKNLHEIILLEMDPVKQAELRRQSVISDFYLGSVHSLTEEGELLIASNTGSQLPHIVFTSPNIIFIVGAQKITSNLKEAFKRLEEHVIPLEDKRMMGVYNAHTQHSKTVILHKENPMMKRKVNVIIVKENLGF